MAGLLDTILNQVMPGPSKNPYGGLLSDAQYQQHRKRQMMKNIGSAGDFLMRASMGDSSGGRSQGGGQGGLLDMMKMNQFQQAQQRGRGQAASQEALTAGNRYNPETGILWDQKPQAGREPRGMLESERGGLLQRAYPEAYGKAMMAQQFPSSKERRIIKGADGYNYYADTQERVIPGAEKETPPQFGEPQYDEKIGKWFQTDPVTKKRLYTSTPSGMDITTPDGTTISTGVQRGGGELGRGPKGALQKEVTTNLQALDRIRSLGSLYEPEFLTYKGMAKGKWATFLNKLDPDERSAFQTRRAAFISAANRDFLTFRKWATGVAGGEKEMAEIKRATFSEDDSPQDFEAKMKVAESLYRRLNARSRAALQEGLDPKRNALAFRRYLKANPLEDIPTIDERGGQLEKLGYEQQQIVKILIDEGYIEPRGR